MREENLVFKRLLDVCRNGHDFYSWTIDQVTNPYLEMVLSNTRDERKLLHEDMLEFALKHGYSTTSAQSEKASFSQFTGRKAYSDTQHDEDDTTSNEMIMRLAELMEDQILTEFYRALASPLPPQIKAKIAQGLSMVEESSDVIKNHGNHVSQQVTPNGLKHKTSHQ